MGAIHNVVIVGSGPAGYTAAVYCARADLEPVLIEGVTYGGALMQTTEVENFPGFVDGIDGPELMGNLRKQAVRFGAKLVTADATALHLGVERKTVQVDNLSYEAEAVILAMGSAYRTMGLPDEQRLSGRGVSWCATCDGFFFRGQDVVVVGGGDSALEEAMFLARICRTVTVVHRREELRASKIMQHRARSHQQIRFCFNSVVTAVAGEERVTGLELIDTTSGARRELEASAVFVAIGHDPRNDLVRGMLPLDPDGYVVVDGRSTATSVPGVFACGDLVDRTYRQAITAAGSGCAAALDVERYLAGFGR
jgi:thioredoxin reductase (NADPH)